MGHAYANPHKVAKDLASADPDAGVDVIVQFKEPINEVHLQKVRNRGDLLKTALQMIHVAVFSVTGASLDALANDPDVTYISPDRK